MMKSKTSALMYVLALGVLAVTASCNGSIDSGDGPAIELQITQLESTAVTAQSAVGGGCTLEVTEWTVTLTNTPKNALAITSPFNDVVLSTVDMAYNWGSIAVTTPPQSFGLGGVTVAVSGTATVDFFPITVQDLAQIAMLGTGGTAGVNMIFRGRMVDGTEVAVAAQGQLFVEPCP